MIGLINISKSALAGAAKPSTKIISVMNQVRSVQTHNIQIQPNDFVTLEEFAGTSLASHTSSIFFQDIPKPIKQTETCKPPTSTRISKVVTIEESKIAKILREQRLAAIREHNFREAHATIQDRIIIPLPFITQKLLMLWDMQVKALRQRRLEESYKQAEAAAQGDMSKAAMMDVYSV